MVTNGDLLREAPEVEIDLSYQKGHPNMGWPFFFWLYYGD
jgi:hypothetical protein